MFPYMFPTYAAMPEPYRVAPFPAITLYPQLPMQNDGIPLNVPSMNLFPQQPGFTNSPAPEAHSDHRPMSSESGRAQMTICYAGQVVIFNDFPADKAKEVINLTSMGSSNPSCNSQNLVKNFSQPSIFLPPRPSGSGVKYLLNSFAQERCIQTRQPGLCGLARKASLGRFLAKRKDRIQARAPYEVSTTLSSSNLIERKSWLALAIQS